MGVLIRRGVLVAAGIVAGCQLVEAKEITYRQVGWANELVFQQTVMAIREVRAANSSAVPPVDGGFSGHIADCSVNRVECIDIADGTIVLAIDRVAFAEQKPYEVRGTRFVPTCASAVMRASCLIGTVKFHGKTSGFLLFSASDGVLAIGLHEQPESAVETVYVLNADSRALFGSGAK